MTSSPSLTVENLGPIEHAEFAFPSLGVHVLTGPNGSGKTTLLDAVSASAAGEGRLPLRDGKNRGKVSCAGATITLGKATRHTGVCEVQHLEGRFDLSVLVDPKLKSPEACDNARIKALVTLMGIEADPKMFRGADEFADFDQVVPVDSLETTDPVEMARRVKAAYDTRAREAEKEAEREDSHAQACAPPADLDLSGEHDADKLLEAVQEATRQAQAVQSQREEWARARALADEARNTLATLSGPAVTSELSSLTVELVSTRDCLSGATQKVLYCEEQLQLAREELKRWEDRADALQGQVDSLSSQSTAIEAAEKIVSSFEALECPPDDAVAVASDAVHAAKQALDRGAMIRAALHNAEKAASHRRAAQEARDRALRYRDAGRATDDALSAAIQCEALRVESDGKATRLVCDTDRGKSIPFHDLSEGERWKIAIDIAADQVGEGGLIVIPQHAWEALDGANRIAVHRHAVERKVRIITAEASADPEAPKEVTAVPFVA